ncbi:hypothetical protein D3C84_576370 [compost metagenome]
MKFDLNGHEISIRRAPKSESRTVLAVYIGGSIKAEWSKNVAELDPTDEFMNKVVKQVWFHRFLAQYNARELAALEKQKKKLGVRRFKEIWGDGDLKKQGLHYLRPYFGSSPALVRQFKKIDGLTLITALE